MKKPRKIASVEAVEDLILDMIDEWEKTAEEDMDYGNGGLDALNELLEAIS